MVRAHRHHHATELLERRNEGVIHRDLPVGVIFPITRPRSVIPSAQEPSEQSRPMVISCSSTTGGGEHVELVERPERERSEQRQRLARHDIEGFFGRSLFERPREADRPSSSPHVIGCDVLYLLRGETPAVCGGSDSASPHRSIGGDASPPDRGGTPAPMPGRSDRIGSPTVLLGGIPSTDRVGDRHTPTRDLRLPRGRGVPGAWHSPHPSVGTPEGPTPTAGGPVGSPPVHGGEDVTSRIPYVDIQDVLPRKP